MPLRCAKTNGAGKNQLHCANPPDAGTRKPDLLPHTNVKSATDRRPFWGPVTEDTCTCSTRCRTTPVEWARRSVVASGWLPPILGGFCMAFVSFWCLLSGC